MEMEDTSSARVTIGFPLGLALLFILFFFICCFFCCCLHWDKIMAVLRSRGLITTHATRHSHSQSSPDLPSSLHKPVLPLVVMKQNDVQSLPVLMPGDEVPRFIAMACPCNPPKDQNITVHVQKDDPSELYNFQ